MAAVPNPTDRKKQEEIRLLVCKGCRRQIDEVGCAYNCEYDDDNFDNRDPEMMEYLVYVFDRTEPYKTKKKRKSRARR